MLKEALENKNLEIKEIVEKWKDDPFIKKQPQSKDKNSLSALFENLSKVSLPPNKGMEAFYEENKYSLTYKIWSQMASKRMVGFQPLVNDSNKLYYIRNEIKENEKYETPDKNSVLESMEGNPSKNPLRTCLCIDALKDLKDFHNIDATQEYLALISSEIAFELDRTIVNRISKNCGTKSEWDFAIALGDTIKEKYESLYVKLVEVSNVVYRKCLAGGANFLFTSPEIASVFECACSGFYPSSSENWSGINLGIQYVGTINNRWRLYKDPLFPPGEIILGYSGDNSMDQGLIFSPKNLFEITGENKDNPGRWDLAADYGLDFTPEGQKYFAKMTVKNFIC